jgi:hypothetical protein
MIDVAISEHTNEHKMIKVIYLNIAVSAGKSALKHVDSMSA